MPYLQEERGVSSPQGSHEATLHTSTWSSIEADLADIVPMLSSNSVPEALQTAFQAADPDFAAPIACALQVPCRRQLHKHDRTSRQTNCTFMPFNLLSYVQISHCRCQVQQLCFGVCDMQSAGFGLTLLFAPHNSRAATNGSCSNPLPHAQHLQRLSSEQSCQACTALHASPLQTAAHVVAVASVTLRPMSGWQGEADISLAHLAPHGA